MVIEKQDDFFRWMEDQRNEKLKRLGKIDVQRRYHEKMQRFAVPELSKHFSEKDIKTLIEYFNQCPTIQTEIEGMRYDLKSLSEEAKLFLSHEINGRHIIEIGDSGRRTNEDLLLKLGAKSYESTDPRGLGIDGLSYLMKQPNNSSIICSFGVFDYGVLYNDFHIPILEEYRQLLGKEIYRLTPIGGITFHGLELFDELEQVGFRKLSFPSIPEDLDTAVSYLSSTGGLKVLRK